MVLPCLARLFRLAYPSSEMPRKTAACVAPGITHLNGNIVRPVVTTTIPYSRSLTSTCPSHPTAPTHICARFPEALPHCGRQGHIASPSFNATSWIGNRRKFGARSRTSTFRPYIAREIRADNLAARTAGLSTASGNSTSRSKSPPAASSRRRDPNTRTWAALPAVSITIPRMDWICFSVRRTFAMVLWIQSSNGCLSTMVSLRSGPVEITSMGRSVSSSIFFR